MVLGGDENKRAAFTARCYSQRGLWRRKIPTHTRPTQISRAT